MTHDEQLDWERSAGRLAGAAAIGSAFTGMAALVVGNASAGGTAHDAAEGVALAHKHPNSIVTAGVLAAISMLLLVPTLLYLFRATRYRRPALPAQARILALVGPPLFAVALVGQAIALNHAVDRTFAKFPLKPSVANHVATEAFTKGAVGTWQLVLLGVGLLVGGAVVLISLHARRAGLLSGFMGVTGIIVGVLLVIPFLGRPPIVYFFWVAGLGLLFLGRWPGQRGRGPAWDSGEAEPWPTVADLRAEQAAERMGGEPESPRARRDRDPEPEPELDGDEPLDDYDYEPTAAAHPRSKKRKRKRRR